MARGIPSWLAHNIVGAGLIVHVLIVIASGWKRDLAEPRRRLCGPILAGADMNASFARGFLSGVADALFGFRRAAEAS